MVRDFIRKNRCLWNGKSVFCLNTMGLFSGDGTGCAARLLKKYGAQILGGVQIKMPDSVCDNKQKNGESNSAAHKSRTEPAQYIVVTEVHKKRKALNMRESSMTAPIMLNLTLIPSRIMLETDLLRRHWNATENSLKSREQ